MIPYIYDIALVLILVLCIGRGYKKGVISSVLNIICLVTAFSLASFLSSYELTVKLYDDYIHQHIMEIADNAVNKAKKEAAEHIRNEADELIDSLLDEIPGGQELFGGLIKDNYDTGEAVLKEGIVKAYEYLGIDIHDLLTNPAVSDKINVMAEKYGSTVAREINSNMPPGLSVEEDRVEQLLRDTSTAETLIYEVFGIKSEKTDTEGIAVYIEKTLIRPAVLRGMGIIIWIAVFTLVNAILRLIVRIILVVRKIEPIKACDSLFGGLLGAVAGILAAAAACALVLFITELTGGYDFMNEEIYSDTIVFGRIYDFIAGMIGMNQPQ